MIYYHEYIVISQYLFVRRIEHPTSPQSSHVWCLSPHSYRFPRCSMGVFPTGDVDLHFDTINRHQISLKPVFFAAKNPHVILNNHHVIFVVNSRFAGFDHAMAGIPRYFTTTASMVWCPTVPETTGRRGHGSHWRGFMRCDGAKHAFMGLMVNLCSEINHGDFWLVGTFLIFPYIGNNHPNWPTQIFQRGSNHQPDDIWFLILVKPPQNHIFTIYLPYIYHIFTTMDKPKAHQEHRKYCGLDHAMLLEFTMMCSSMRSVWLLCVFLTTGSPLWRGNLRWNLQCFHTSPLSNVVFVQHQSA